MKYPKIVITGPFNSGKSEFIKQLSEIRVVETEEVIHSDGPTEKPTTTIVMDFGRKTIDKDTIVYLFGTPGQDRFDFMWEILSKNMLGFIVMVDSTKKDLSAAIDILKFFKNRMDVPYIIAANKQDLPGALDVENIRKLLEVPKEVDIVECVATDKKSALKVLNKLLEKIER
ncbi:MAG: ATP/GTP-binding protein [Candidatus Methanofastidiosa archaeon]|nr:ATP/GTP-binding protein [Candidatus Methanofastidiosa archaeon]